MAARENRENVNLIFSQNMAYKMSFLGSLGMKSLLFYSVLKQLKMVTNYVLFIFQNQLELLLTHSILARTIGVGKNML